MIWVNAPPVKVVPAAMVISWFTVQAPAAVLVLPFITVRLL